MKETLFFCRWLLAAWVGAAAAWCEAQPETVARSRGETAGHIYQATDTLLPLSDSDSPTAQALLETIGYVSSPFTVTLVNTQDDPVVQSRRRFAAAQPLPDARVWFPSPRPREGAGQMVNTVRLDWFAAKSPDGTALTDAAPAVLVIHTLGDQRFIANAIAQSLADKGIHAFVMHMPGFADRRLENQSRYDADVFFTLCAQAVADARRSHDAIAALPGVLADKISIQGTSLGGFITSSAASLDHSFDQAFITLAGADLYTVFTQGRRESWGLRRLFADQGLTDDALKTLCESIDPGNLAHRLDPQRTWLFSAMSDQVVPAASANALALAAHLPETRHLWLQGDHYTAIFAMPWVVQTMTAAILDGDQPGDDEPDALPHNQTEPPSVLIEAEESHPVSATQ